jgi:periplasmic protein TonB
MATAVDTLAPLRSRAFALAAIAGGHVLLVYFLMNGLAQQLIAIVSPPPIVTSFIPDEHPRPQPPPVITHEPDSKRLTQIDQPPYPPPITDPADPPRDPPSIGTVIEEPRGSTVALPALVLIGKNVLPNTEDYYPARARRAGLEGISEVRVCVDERGRLQGDPTIQHSSGSGLLDAGAIAVVRAGNYARATRGGVPVPNCYGFRIAFHMK